MYYLTYKSMNLPLEFKVSEKFKNTRRNKYTPKQNTRN